MAQNNQNKNQNNLFKKPKKNRRQVFAVVFFAALLAALAALAGWFEISYAESFYPGVKINSLSLGGKTKPEVLERLKAIEAEIKKQGLKFIAEGQEIKIDPLVISTFSPDFARPLLIFDWQKTVDEAYTAGRGGNWPQNLKDQIKILIFGRQMPVAYNLDQPELINILTDKFSGLEKPPAEAKLEIKNGQAEVSAEQSGYIFDYQKAAGELAVKIEAMQLGAIKLDLIFTEPKIKKQDTAEALKGLDKILALEEIKLRAEGKEWKLAKEKFSAWLEFQFKGNQVVLAVNKDQVLAYLAEIAKEVDVPVVDAKIELAGERVISFTPSQEGKNLDQEKAYENISANILAGQGGEIELLVAVTPVKIATGDVNDLGIKELIGRGVSNFKGSPKNRRHNIAVGAKSLNGILIKPGEEFSLLKALGPIDGEHGYLQELVIKGNRTVPEYGGGLCQIGTTTFRAALRSGLPITQRQNHSYRVVYYEPAGMDATIYDPWPDFRFLNDTGFYILFMARVEGDDLIFDFYGTKDGRKVVINPDPPKIFNITGPGPVRYIDSTDLKPGEKKKLESPHSGADTYFKYTVTYPSGEVKEQEFKSHYVPWPEVWLVGAAPSSTEPIVSLPPG